MYSVVLMMALSGGAQTPEFCHGCWGCGCYGGCGGYASWGCGCYGGYASWGCGCYGGCGGYASYGCGSYGGCGGYASYGCGCYGGGYASYGCGGYSGCGYSHGCGGCYGVSYHGCSSYGCGHYSGGHYGCGHYGHGGHTACCGGGAAIAPIGPSVQPAPIPAPEKGKVPPPPQKKGPVNGDNSARGTIEVNVPANATLTFDGHPTTQTSTQRHFHTPVLENGRDYFYTVRAEAMVDGQNVVKTEQVTVRRGQTSRINFDFATSSVAAR